MPLSTQSYSPANTSAAAAPAVVLIHGFASTSEADWLSTGWPEAINALARTAVTIDLPGHGSNSNAASESASTTTVVQALSTAIDEALAASGAEYADVVAYSLGARLAWELPAANPRIRRIVLGGISPFEPFAQLDTAELRAVAAGNAGPSSPLVGMMAQMVSAPGNDAAALIGLIDGLASEPFSPGDSSSAPTVPALFVAGSDDMMTGGIESLVELVPDAKLMHVPGDHRGALTSPEFRAAALSFLA